MDEEQSGNDHSSGERLNRNRVYRHPELAPLMKMTMRLEQTYWRILHRKISQQNDQQLQQQDQSLPEQREVSSVGNPKRYGLINSGYDDPHHYYTLYSGELIDERYRIEDFLCVGSSGQVVKAFDQVEGQDVTLRIVQSGESHHAKAEAEINMFEFIQSQESIFRHYIAYLKRHFVWQQHLCLVFVLMSCNLNDYSKMNNFLGVPLQLTSKIGFQIAAALAFLSSPNLGVVHCNLKPESVMLRYMDKTSVMILDLHSAQRIDNGIRHCTQSLYYRSPEIILGLPCGATIDMWSLGCMLVELHTGEILFAGENEFDQLMRMIEVLGMPPNYLLDVASKADKYFCKTDDETYVCCKLNGRSYKQPGTVMLKDVLGASSGGPGARHCNRIGHRVEDYFIFLELIEDMLRYDPARRITPSDALKHPFLDDSLLVRIETLLS